MASSLSPLKLDVRGRQFELTRAQAESLRDAAALRASSAAPMRDLALVLERALRTGRTVALHRGEARALAELAAAGEGEEFSQLPAALLAALGIPSRGG